MANLIYTTQFLDDVETIWSPRVMDRLTRILHMLESFPESGSPNIPPSIARSYGPDVRICMLNPFDLIYEYDRTNDAVVLYGLVSQKSAR